MSNKNKVEDILSVFLMNVQGLTVHKWNEWQEMIEKNNSKIKVSMFTETQHKIEKVFFGDNYKYEVGMRGEHDKKGGGLMIGSNDEVSIVKVESGNVDVLCVDVEVRKSKMRVILTYWDVRDSHRNDRIVTCIRGMVERYEGKLMVLGDMNAHLGFLGQQELNRNGVKLLNLMEECGLVLLNLDEACRGEITREEGGHKSVIDFVLVNVLLYDDFLKMDIDERKELFDLSDHCMIRVDFRIGVKGSDERVQKRIEYYRVKDDMKEMFLQKIEEKLVRMNEDEQECVFHDAVTRVCEEVLKRTRVVRGNPNENEWESVWMNEEIRLSLIHI